MILVLQLIKIGLCSVRVGCSDFFMLWDFSVCFWFWSARRGGISVLIQITNETTHSAAFCCFFRKCLIRKSALSFIPYFLSIIPPLGNFMPSVRLEI